MNFIILQECYLINVYNVEDYMNNKLEKLERKRL
jgi:hypothetical protein